MLRSSASSRASLSSWSSSSWTVWRILLLKWRLLACIIYQLYIELKQFISNLLHRKRRKSFLNHHHNSWVASRHQCWQFSIPIFFYLAQNTTAVWHPERYSDLYQFLLRELFLNPTAYPISVYWAVYRETLIARIPIISSRTLRDDASGLFSRLECESYGDSPENVGVLSGEHVLSNNSLSWTIARFIYLNIRLNLLLWKWVLICIVHVRICELNKSANTMIMGLHHNLLHQASELTGRTIVWNESLWQKPVWLQIF